MQVPRSYVHPSSASYQGGETVMLKLSVQECLT